MANCPHGHPNPSHYEFCGECGTPLEQEAEPSSTRPWYRTRSAIGAACVFAAVLIAVVALTVTAESEKSGSPAPTTDLPAAIEKWWSGAHEHFTELQSALDDSQRALGRLDSPALEAACQRMEDASGVDLPAHLPTPDPDLTSALAAATADAHAAAHMCLSAAAGSQNNYYGEFPAAVEQADKHLAAAQELINKALTQGV